jgi:hypothetical protein
MSPAAIIALVAQYGPAVIPIIQQLVAWVEGNKATVTAAELQQLVALGQYNSAQSLAAKGIAIVNGQVVHGLAA